MNELIWILSSCVLIVAVLLIRALFGRKLRPGLRYALWALVLVRLLLPGSLWTGPVNVEAPVSRTQLGQDLDLLREVDTVTYSPAGQVSGAPARPAATGEAAEEPVILAQDVTPERFERLRSTLSLRHVAETVWVTGSVAVLAIFAATNVLFYVNLRRRRRRLDMDAPVRVYEVEGLESSCLFLNAIYVNSETAADDTKLRHVLAHELSHRRHLDGLWALMRCAALTVHWFNPLVWLAASKSRQDSELFADAGALRHLGEAQRESYGGTLISLSVHNARAVSPLCAATAMAGGKRSLRERVELIARKPKATVAVLLAVAFIAGIAVGCTFAGAAYEEPKAGGKNAADPSGTDPAVTTPAGTGPTETSPTATAPSEPAQTHELSVYESAALNAALLYPTWWNGIVTLSDSGTPGPFILGLSRPVLYARIDLREDVFGVPPYDAGATEDDIGNALAIVYWLPAGMRGPEAESGESVTLYIAEDGSELRCWLPMNTKLNWLDAEAGSEGDRIFNAYDTVEWDIRSGSLFARPGDQAGGESYGLDQAGTVSFYAAPTEEAPTLNRIKPVRYLAQLTAEQADRIDRILNSVDMWQDDNIVNRTPFYFDGELKLANSDRVVYFSDESNVLYYDHYYAKISEEDMQYLMNIGQPA